MTGSEGGFGDEKPEGREGHFFDALQKSRSLLCEGKQRLDVPVQSRKLSDRVTSESRTFYERRLLFGAYVGLSKTPCLGFKTR